jgi:subtilisin family serine protease
VPGATPIEGLNAAVFDKEPVGIKSADLVVQKELVHYISPFSCSRCETIPCPGPAPTPTPTPTPTPSPVEDDKSWGRKRVRAALAQQKVDTSNVKVCVIDTGIDLNHPNKGNVIASQSYTGGTVQDRQGHGTHTAGTVAGTGGVGVSKAKLLICKGLGDDGSGGSASLAQCLAWCGQQGAQIVSNSWGSTQPDGFINQAIKQLTDRGIYVFVAAGNDSGPVNWPAKLAGSVPLVYAVAASNENDQIASFSSRGQEIRYIAPGEGINSNWPNGGTKSLSGTSMATPHAAAVCAFGIAKGIKPCIKTNGTVGGYPMVDALTTAE